MTNNLDFIDNVTSPAPTETRKRGRSFDDGLAGATRRQVAKATGRRSAARGNYVQLTFRLPEEAAERIGRMAAEAGVTKEDMKRWLVWYAMAAWDEGERPPVSETTTQRVELPW